MRRRFGVEFESHPSNKGNRWPIEKSRNEAGFEFDWTILTPTSSKQITYFEGGRSMLAFTGQLTRIHSFSSIHKNLKYLVPT